MAESPPCIGDKQKHVLASLGATPCLRRFPLIFCVSAHCDPSLSFQVSSRLVQVWGDMTEKPLHDPQSECHRLFEPIAREGGKCIAMLLSRRTALSGNTSCIAAGRDSILNIFQGFESELQTNQMPYYLQSLWGATIMPLRGFAMD